jgi:hypothetical protein
MRSKPGSPMTLEARHEVRELKLIQESMRIANRGERGVEVHGGKHTTAWDLVGGLTRSGHGQGRLPSSVTSAAASAAFLAASAARLASSSAASRRNR